MFIFLNKCNDIDVENNGEISPSTNPFHKLVSGHKGQLAPRCRALDAMIKKFYHGIQKAVHQFRFKNVEQHLLLGSGGNNKSKTQL